MNHYELVREDMQTLLADLRNDKPDDRSEEDRHYAIIITDMEKVLALFEYYFFTHQVKPGD